MDSRIDSIELRVPSKAEYVSIIRAFVTDLARRLGLSPSAIEDIQVAVSEACSNVVRHAYPEDRQQRKDVVLRFGTEDGRLVMEIADCGRGFCEGVPEAAPVGDENGGFGLSLIYSLMEHVSLKTSPQDGTVVRMSKETARVGRRANRPRRL